MLFGRQNQPLPALLSEPSALEISLYVAAASALRSLAQAPEMSIPNYCTLCVENNITGDTAKVIEEIAKQIGELLYRKNEDAGNLMCGIFFRYTESEAYQTFNEAYDFRTAILRETTQNDDFTQEEQEDAYQRLEIVKTNFDPAIPLNNFDILAELVHEIEDFNKPWTLTFKDDNAPRLS